MADIFTDSIGRYTNETILEAIRKYTKIIMGGGGTGMLNLLSLNGLSWLLAEEGWTSATGNGLDNAHQPAVAMHQKCDAAGVVTVGPGITNKSSAGNAIVDGKSYTFEECVDFLANEISKICDGLQEKAPDVLQLGQKCTDALIVYHFNTGNAYGRWKGCTTADDVATKILGGPHGNSVNKNQLDQRRSNEAGIANDTITIENANDKTRAYFEIHPLAEEIMKLKGTWVDASGGMIAGGDAPVGLEVFQNINPVPFQKYASGDYLYGNHINAQIRARTLKSKTPPATFMSMARAYSQKSGLPLNILVAIGASESGWKNNPLNGAGYGGYFGTGPRFGGGPGQPFDVQASFVLKAYNRAKQNSPGASITELIALTYISHHLPLVGQTWWRQVNGNIWSLNPDWIASNIKAVYPSISATRLAEAIGLNVCAQYLAVQVANMSF